MVEITERRRFPRPAADADGNVQTRSALDQFSGRIALARGVGVALSAMLLVGERPAPHVLVALGALVAWALGRWRHPIRDTSPARLGLALVAEVAVATGAVAVTGGWNSPLAPSLMPALLIVGLSERGLLPAAMALLASGLVTAAWTADIDLGPDELTIASQGTFVLLIITGVTNFAARSVTTVQEANAQQAASLTRLRGANELLEKLHELALHLPASLDLRDVIDRTISNARSLTGADVVAILLRERDLPGWSVAGADGAYLPTFVTSEHLAPHLAEATRSKPGLRVGDAAHSLSGVAAVSIGIHLRARNRDLGILVLEYLDDTGLDIVHVSGLASQMVETVALAIDNARWFRAIERTAADDERLRIARDLHDRLGQSVALVGFELDTVRRSVDDAHHPGLADELDTVRGHVRGIVTELRETLYDLRTEVTTDRNLVATVTEFLQRVEARSDLDVTFEHDVRHQLPPRQERELWLITQEAIVNAERHASASHIDVVYAVGDGEILVEVTDDGRGMAATAGRPDSYGLRGLRERAAAIGGRIEITTNDGQGTIVRCRVPRR